MLNCWHLCLQRAPAGRGCLSRKPGTRLLLVEGSQGWCSESSVKNVRGAGRGVPCWCLVKLQIHPNVHYQCWPDKGFYLVLSKMETFSSLAFQAMSSIKHHPDFFLFMITKIHFKRFLFLFHTTKVKNNSVSMCEMNLRRKIRVKSNQETLKKYFYWIIQWPRDGSIITHFSWRQVGVQPKV